LNISGTVSASVLKFLLQVAVVGGVVVLYERNHRRRIWEVIRGQRFSVF